MSKQRSTKIAMALKTMQGYDCRTAMYGEATSFIKGNPFYVLKIRENGRKMRVFAMTKNEYGFKHEDSRLFEVAFGIQTGMQKAVKKIMTECVAPAMADIPRLQAIMDARQAKADAYAANVAKFADAGFAGDLHYANRFTGVINGLPCTVRVREDGTVNVSVDIEMPVADALQRIEHTVLDTDKRVANIVESIATELGKFNGYNIASREGNVIVFRSKPKVSESVFAKVTVEADNNPTGVKVIVEPVDDTCLSHNYMRDVSHQISYRVGNAIPVKEVELENCF